MNDDTERTAVVVLERVTIHRTTDYCVHGRVKCVTCGHWCWLGNRTLDLVSTGAALPVCQPCVRELIPPGTPVDCNANDHRRADGPHT